MLLLLLLLRLLLLLLLLLLTEGRGTQKQEIPRCLLQRHLGLCRKCCCC